MPASLLLTALLAAGPVARILVTDVKPRVGVQKELAQGITDDLVAEVRKRVPHATVLGTEDIQSMLGVQQQKQRMGCSDVSCLAELGGALGASSMITGTLAKFGSTYLLNLQFLDVRAARVMREASLKLKSNSDDQLLDVVGRAVAQILPAEPAEPPAPSISAPIESTSPTPIREVSVTEPAAATRSHVLGWTLIGGAVASAAVAAVGGIEVLNYTNLDSQLKSQKIPAGVTYQSALGQRNAANGWADASLVLVGVAVACGVGAVVTW